MSDAQVARLTKLNLWIRTHEKRAELQLYREQLRCAEMKGDYKHCGDLQTLIDNCPPPNSEILIPTNHENQLSVYHAVAYVANSKSLDAAKAYYQCMTDGQDFVSTLQPYPRNDICGIEVEMVEPSMLRVILSYIFEESFKAQTPKKL